MIEDDWQERVRLERHVLGDKIGKLEAFRATQVYRDLPQAERDRLTAQLIFMRGYQAMLTARIEAFQ